MWNRNVLIVGQPGAGKTQLAKRLVQLAPRVVIFDPVTDYDPGESGVLVWTGEAAIAELAERWDEPFRIVIRAESDEEYAVVASMIERIQREPGALAITVLMEEAAIYSGSTFAVAEPIKRLYTLGRRWRVNCLAVTQVDTDVHRVFRHATHMWVAMRSLKLSTDLQRYFDSERVAALESLRPGDTAAEGIHYEIYPSGADLFAEFERANRWDRNS
jgi:KaiC/GvpD/RAD55 family RecA-like ATPase